MNEIIVVVPTRGRPVNAKTLLEAWADTGTTRADLMFVVDDDDPCLSEYRSVVPQRWLTVGKRERLGPTLNREAMRWADTYEVVGFMGDDHVPRTDGWDLSVLYALRRPGVRVAYGNDLLQGERLATAVFMHGDLISALGYMCPPHQIHLYLDDFWMLLGRAVGMTYMPDTVIEHVHPVAGKTPWDAGYREVNDLSVYEHDRTAFDVYLRHVWQEELARLRSLGY